MERSCPRRITCPRERANARRVLQAEGGIFARAIALPVEDVLGELPQLDHVICVTRNTAAALTSVGRYAAPQPMGERMVVEPGRMCLRIRPASLGRALFGEAVPHHRRPLSLHFLDREGAVLHETYLTSLDETPALGLMASARAGDDDDGDARLDPAARAPAESWSWRPRRISPAAGKHDDAGVHVDSILGDNGIARRASLPQWGASSAWQIDVNDLIGLFMLLKEAWMPLGIAVGNVGLVQYHQGEIDGVKSSGALIQVSSKHSNVTISLDDIEEAWVTCVDVGGRREHMLELYDWRYHCVAQFKDADDSDENLSVFWGQILDTLPRVPATATHRT